MKPSTQPSCSGKLYADVYRLHGLFIMQPSESEATEWLRRQLGRMDFEVPRGDFNAVTLTTIDDTGRKIFVIWVRWLKLPEGYARLAHECLHVAVNMLTYAGYSPRMTPKASEPLAYLVDCLMRQVIKIVAGLSFVGNPARPEGSRRTRQSRLLRMRTRT